MKFEVKHSTNHYLRLRIVKRSFADNEAFTIKQLLLDNEKLKVSKIIVNQKPASLIIEHDGNQEDIENYLKELTVDDLNVDIPESNTALYSKKEFYKRLTPQLKRELKKEILMEAALDILLPEPIGIAYHLLQVACLEAEA